MKIFRQFFFSSFLLFTLFLPQDALAQTKWSERCVGPSNYHTDASDVATIAGLECLLANVLATFMTILGIAAFVMFLIGSFQYLTAGSNAKGVETGRNSITFAIAGIVLALASYLILRFIADFTGIQTILNFKVVNL